MTNDNGGGPIIRYYEEYSAATGEGARYECADGSIWRDAQPFERAEGIKLNGQIIARHAT